MVKRLVMVLVVMVGFERSAYGDLVYLVAGSTTTVDFTGYGGAGFQPIPTAGQLDSDDWAATGWTNGDLDFGGTQITAGTDYTRGTTSGGVGTGGFYAVSNITPTSGISFGIQPGGNDWAPGTLTLQIRNNSGVTLESISVGYDLFVRNDQDRSSSFNFSYAVGALNTPGAFVGSAINNDSFVSAAGADVLGWVNQRSASTLTTFATSVANGQSVFLRWSGADVGGANFRDEFAIDNVSFSGVTAVPEPSSLLLLGLAGVSVGVGRRWRRKKMVV